MKTKPALKATGVKVLEGAIYKKWSASDIEGSKLALAESQKLQNSTCTKSIDRCVAASPAACMVLLPWLNSMIDVAYTQTVITHIHPSLIICILLI